MTSNNYGCTAQVWAETKDFDSVLRHLRENGFSKLESIKALRELCGISLGEAKRKASLSEVWADTLDDSNRLHDAFLEGASEIHKD